MNRPTALLGVVGALVLVGSACGGDDAADDTGGPIVVTTDSTAPADTADPSTTGAPTTAPESPPVDPSPMGDPEIDVVQVATLELPVALAGRSGDPSLYVVEQPGRVTAVDPVSGEARTVLDISDLTVSQGERGLLGLAFAPSGDLAYVNYTDVAGDTVIAEYPVEPAGTFDRDSARVLLQLAQPFGNHNGGHLEFGPDGYLYIGTGDGGSGGDPQRTALDPGDLLGKLLRIDPTPSGDAAYRVPDDNPFVGVADARPEVFSIGLRNPWKFTFDPVTDDLWIADVGQNELEEVNRVPAPDDGTTAGAGVSFGWSAFEGTERFNTDQDPDGHLPPVITYANGVDGCSVSGGAPYRGAAIPELVGSYVYSDYCSGTLWAFDPVAGRNLVIGGLSAVTGVQPGPDGELYVLSHQGGVYRIVPAG